MNIDDSIHADFPRQSPTAQQEASADMISTLRAFQVMGAGMRITAEEVGHIANHIEALAVLVDNERQAVYLLIDRLREMDLLLRAHGDLDDSEIKH